MEYAAIYHDMDKRYCYAVDKNKFIIRITTKKGDMEKVTLHTQDKYIPLVKKDTRAEYPMEKAASDEYHDYYETELTFSVICLRYFFELTDKAGMTAYYGNYEFSGSVIESIDKMFDCPQNLREEERFVTPEWAKNAVVYQIFPARFASSENQKDSHWYKAPIGHRDNLHGDLRGMISHLPHMKELGVDVLYLTPIFQSGSSHKYDTIDYKKIDPSFGTEEDLKELAEKAHELGMRIILDGVFNHTSPKFFAFADIEKNKENSSYLDWYFIEKFPLFEQDWKQINFKTFGYYGGMPKLNLRNPEVEQYVFDVAEYWIKRCGIDGWRLDVGDEIGHRFWKRFREKVKSVNPEALIIGEVWHPANDYLEGDEWDTMMNYHFFLTVKDFVADGSITATEFADRMDFMRGTVHSAVYPLLWNLIDSHDTARFMYLCGEQKEKFKLAAAIQLLSPGMPMIFYGDEYGMKGGGDPDCRRGMLWKEEYQDLEIYSWYRKLIALRKKFPALTSGKLTALKTEDRQGIVQYEKTAENGERITLMFHNSPGELELPEKRGQIEEISGQVFDGVVKPYQTLVFSEKGQVSDESYQ